MACCVCGMVFTETKIIFLGPSSFLARGMGMSFCPRWTPSALIAKAMSILSLISRGICSFWVILCNAEASWRRSFVEAFFSRYWIMVAPPARADWVMVVRGRFPASFWLVIT